jgi:hypothetical protein
MSYTLKLTNGRILLNLSDQKIDQLTTSLTLIGKNVPSYGTYFNENLIYLLENFASPSQPRSPLYGQLWYNSAQGRMFYYNNNNQFRPVGGPVVSPIQPTGPVPGDLWLDTVNKRLTVFDGTNFIPAGKNYDTPQGKAGWIVEEIIDTNTVTRTVSSLYNNNVLLAILSEVAFTPATPYQGIAYVGTGLTMNNSLYPGSTATIIATVTNALSIAGVSANVFLRNNTNQTTTGSLAILNDGGLSIGKLQNLELYINSGTYGDGSTNILSQTIDAHFNIVTNSSVYGTINPITVAPLTKALGIWTTTPQDNLDVNGNVTIRGNLNVVGTGTNVQVKNLEVDNIKIELAYPVNSLPDAAVDGGGVILHGTTDHSLTYKNALPGWSSTDNITVANNKAYFVTNAGGADIRVLDAASVYVQTAPNLTSVGTLGNLNVGNVSISTSSIYTTDGVSDLVLNKPGVGNVSLGGKKVVNSGTITPFDTTTTLVTKYYVDNIQALKNSIQFVFSLDVTQVSDVNGFVISYLNKMLPIGTSGGFYYIPEQARCRVLCMNYANPSFAVDGVSNYAVTAVDQNGVKNAVNVVTGVTVRVTSPVTYPAVSQEVREFIVSGGQWTFSTTIS